MTFPGSRSQCEVGPVSESVTWSLTTAHLQVLCKDCSSLGVLLSPGTHVGTSHPAAADQSRMMQEQMTGAAMAMPADTNKAFKVHSLLPASLMLPKVFARVTLKIGSLK